MLHVRLRSTTIDSHKNWYIVLRQVTAIDKKSGKHGFVNTKFHFAIPPKYTKARSHVEGMAVVRTQEGDKPDDTIVFIDTQDNIIHSLNDEFYRVLRGIPVIQVIGDDGFYYVSIYGETIRSQSIVDSSVNAEDP